ncbi:uncharacterized protein [Rutidosis leptorrhynchoides]|uniref:uncharacterized protein n=1 Tax=Rutidosis leptorrhynchoides TaxID=125765 RepID=UPI003A99E7D6
MRTIVLTVLSTDGSTLPSQVTVSVPNNGQVKDLIRALTAACCLGDDETLLVAEIYFNRMIHLLDVLEAPLELLRDEDDQVLVAYRLLKDDDYLPLVVFIHRFEGNYGIPLVAKIPECSNGVEVHRKFLKLLQPFCIQEEIPVNGSFGFQFNHNILSSETSEMVMDEELLISSSRKICVTVTWSDEMLKRYDTTTVFSHLPPTASNPPKPVSLFACLEAFSEEEHFPKKCVLPLPSTTMRSIELTVLSTDGSTLPYQVTVIVPKNGVVNDLYRVVTTALSLGDDETLLVAEIYFNRMIHFLDLLEAPLHLFGDDYDEAIVVYRLLKDEDSLPLAVFIHNSGRNYGIPQVARISECSNGLDIHRIFIKLLQPFCIQEEEYSSVNGSFGFRFNHDICSDERSEMVMDKELLLIPSSRIIYVFVTWPHEMLKRYDTTVFNHLPPTSSVEAFSEEDPFMKKCVLPLPSTTTMRSIVLTVLSTDGSTLPSQVTVSVPKNGVVKDLIRALTTACCLGDDETLLVAKIYFNNMIHLLDALEAPIHLIGDEDDDEVLVAYRLLKDDDSLPLAVFIHRYQRNYGIPQVARISECSNGLDIHRKFIKLLQPFCIQEEEYSSVDGSFGFWFNHDIWSDETSEMVMDKELLLIPSSRIIYVFVTWPHEMLKRYNATVFSHLPPTSSVEAFSEEDPFLKKCDKVVNARYTSDT